MKRSVYISGISCAILMLIGCISKIMHWPGASVAIIVSVFLFCFWFLPAGLMNSYQTLPLKKMKALHIITFLVFALCMMGVLFKVMHWPGAGMFLFPGLMLPFVVFLPVYLYHTREEEKTGNKNFFAITLGLTFLAVFSVFLAMSISKHVIIQATTSVNTNEAETNLIRIGSNDSDISKTANDLSAYTDELKCELLSGNDLSMCDGNKINANYTAENISNLYNRDQIKHNFTSEEGTLKIKLLKEKINIFSKTVLASKNINPELAELTKLLFDTSDNDVNGVYNPGISWERREFENYPLIFTLDFLSKLQNNVRLVEGEALK